MDPGLQQLLSEHKEFFSVQEDGKIKCLLNGHCFPPRADVLKPFISGSKYQKLATRAKADESLEKYQPFIMQSTNFPLMLYCALTGQLIDKSLDAVKLHMKGRKWKQAKERFDADQQDLKPEPTIESLGFKPKSPAAATEAGGPEDEASIPAQEEQAEGEEAKGASSSAEGTSEDDEEEEVEEERDLHEDMERLFAAGEDEDASASGSEDGAMDVDAAPSKAGAKQAGRPKGKKGGPMVQTVPSTGDGGGGDGTGAQGSCKKQKKRQKAKKESIDSAAKAAAVAGPPPQDKSRKRNVNKPSAAKKMRKS